MPVDFRKMMTPEQRERWDKYKHVIDGQKARFAAMDNDTLANSAEYYMSQMHEAVQYGPGCSTYNAAFYHAIVPEILRRLRGK